MKVSGSHVAVIVTAVVHGVARPLLIGYPHGHLLNGFTAMAHVFVGGLLGGWLTTRRSLFLCLAGVLSVIEVVSAIIANT